MILPVTLTMAAAAAILNLWLAIRVSARRMGRKVLVGDGGDPDMETRIRAHANFTEYAPFVLVLIAVIELSGGSPAWLWAAGAAFVLGRIAHGIGMPVRRTNALRAGGALSTWVVLALLAGWALAIAYHAAADAPVRGIPVESPARG